MMERYAAILTHSEHMRDEMHRHGLRADIVPYVVATCSPAPQTESTDHWRLLYAGRMESLKGGGYLIDALSDVARAAHKPVHVVMAGEGRERSAWEARARVVQANTPSLSITFTGWLMQSQVEALMDQCDLLVMPSVWPEPFGSVGPAAGRHGVPAVAFDSGGIRTWLADGVTGHVAPDDPPTPQGLAAAIIRCLQDPAHHATLRNGARQMSARFTMERHVPALMERLSAAAAR